MKLFDKDTCDNRTFRGDNGENHDIEPRPGWHLLAGNVLFVERAEGK